MSLLAFSHLKSRYFKVVMPGVISTQVLVVTEQASFQQEKSTKSEEKNLSVNTEMVKLKEPTAKLTCTYVLGPLC